jgi:glycosyltransferase involved in cell wall biosynthesis
MISGRDVLYISSIDWSFQWQGPQEIAVRLGAAGNRVLYVENTGIRAPRLHEAARIANRLGRWAEGRLEHGVRDVATNVQVCSPLVLPPFGSVWQRAANRALLPAQLRGAFPDFRPTVIWTYLPTDTVLDLASGFDGSDVAVVYYCVADFSQYAPRAERLEASERALVERADAVFVSCDALAERFGRAPHVHTYPFGVDLDNFRPDRPGPVPPELAELRRPIIGYVGALERAVDLELMIAMARARPDWSWVYVGTIRRDVSALGDLPNVRVLGQRPHRALPDFLRRFDVAIVPYARNRFTETVVPTKINEYLAMGKPVVATDLPSVRAFDDRHRVLTAVPPERDAFLAAIEAALPAADAGTVAHRRAVAAEADWSTRLEAMSALIEKKLRARTG